MHNISVQYENFISWIVFNLIYTNLSLYFKIILYSIYQR